MAYIEREALVVATENSLRNNPHSDPKVRQVHNHEHRHFLVMVAKQPAVDVAEVRHGEWLVEAYPVDSDEVVIFPYKEHQHNDPFCSICGEHALLNGGEEYVASNYCPNCGAKMDGEGENDV